MFLEQFAKLDNIYIQCHDSPDADALGAGFALYSYFKKIGKDVHLVFSGENEITKPSLCIMVDELGIPIEYVQKLEDVKVLITIDCQYAGGNVSRFDAERVSMIDHHPCSVSVDEWCCIRSDYGSCCTVVWELLQEAGYDVNENIKVATALYYGLYSDTGQLSEIYHPKDKEMRDFLVVDRTVLDDMISSNLSRNELKIAAEALQGYYYDKKYRLALVKTRPCDPNLLGFISDLVNQVAAIDLCVAYNETPIGYKLSMRSSLAEYPACEMAETITYGIGTGGGHKNKAGGFVMKRMFERLFPDRDFEDMMMSRIRQRLENQKG